jgi:hypothetical protein
MTSVELISAIETTSEVVMISAIESFSEVEMIPPASISFVIAEFMNVKLNDLSSEN